MCCGKSHMWRAFCTFPHYEHLLFSWRSWKFIMPLLQIFNLQYTTFPLYNSFWPKIAQNWDIFNPGTDPESSPQNPLIFEDYTVIRTSRTSAGRPDHLAADRGRDRVAKVPYPFNTNIDYSTVLASDVLWYLKALTNGLACQLHFVFRMCTSNAPGTFSPTFSSSSWGPSIAGQTNLI